MEVDFKSLNPTMDSIQSTAKLLEKKDWIMVSIPLWIQFNGFSGDVTIGVTCLNPTMDSIQLTLSQNGLFIKETVSIPLWIQFNLPSESRILSRLESQSHYGFNSIK